MATQEKKGISAELLDGLLAGRDAAEVFRSGALIDELKKAVAERAAGRGDGRASRVGARGRGRQPPERAQPQAGAERTVARWTWRCRGTGTGASIRGWWRSTAGGCRGSTSVLCQCIPA